METNLKHIGNVNGYNVFVNRDGFLEGYKHSGSKSVDETGKAIGGKVERIVTETKSLEEFAALTAPKKKSYLKPDDNQGKLFG